MVDLVAYLVDNVLEGLGCLSVFRQARVILLHHSIFILVLMVPFGSVVGLLKDRLETILLLVGRFDDVGLELQLDVVDAGLAVRPLV